MRGGQLQTLVRRRRCIPERGSLNHNRALASDNGAGEIEPNDAYRGATTLWEGNRHGMTEPPEYVRAIAIDIIEGVVRLKAEQHALKVRLRGPGLGATTAIGCDTDIRWQASSNYFWHPQLEAVRGRELYDGALQGPVGLGEPVTGRDCNRSPSDEANRVDDPQRFCGAGLRSASLRRT